MNLGIGYTAKKPPDRYLARTVNRQKAAQHHARHFQPLARSKLLASILKKIILPSSAPYLCRFRFQLWTSSVGAAYSDDVAPDGA